MGTRPALGCGPLSDLDFHGVVGAVEKPSASVQELEAWEHLDAFRVEEVMVGYGALEPVVQAREREGG